MGVKRLGYVLIEARDLETWRAFGAGVLGLMPGRGDENTLSFRMDDRPFRFLIRKGQKDGFVAAGWEYANKKAFEAGVGRLQEAGLKPEHGDKREAKLRSVEEFVRCIDPSGNVLELSWGNVLDYAPFVSPAGVSGFVTGELGLGHVVLPALKIEESRAFYTDVLGFGMTDTFRLPMGPGPDPATMAIYFLHCDNPRHHSLALAEMPQPSGLVHVMVEAASLDDVGRALDRALAVGAPITSTLGRHANDKMVSFYVRSPGGFDFEFGCQGWQVDWTTFTPTISLVDSHWGHKWAPPPEAS